MTKKILGLDLGTNSIGWALVEEAEHNQEESKIIKLGVRVNPLTIDEKINFEKGKPITTNADRTLKRGARKNLQRFKLRRENLRELLSKNNIISKDFILAEKGKESTHSLLQLRARAAKEKISLIDFARVLFVINKKRGYKSSRKTKQEVDGTAIDGMGVAKLLYEEKFTPGQYGYKLLKEGKKYIPDFYQSDLQTEFLAIWQNQQKYYPSILNEKLFEELQEKNKSQTWAICKEPFNIVGIKLEGKASDQKNKKYELRSLGLSEKLDLEQLAIVLQEINNDKKKSSGYLGAISDRSKILFMDKITVGEYLWQQKEKDFHISLKNQVFYRQDYLDEFETIWETQAKYHSELTSQLKEEIRDVVIFYQRKLKSQKGLLSFCQFESWWENRKDEKGTVILNKLTGNPKQRQVGHRVIPKSSPLFQEFKIWQNINNLLFVNKISREEYQLTLADKKFLFKELNVRGELTEKQVLKMFSYSDKEWHTNQPIIDYKKQTRKAIEGNRTNKTLFNVYQTIIEREGYGFDWNKKSAEEILQELKAVFSQIGIKADILTFNSESNLDKQASFQLWHLLYSATDDGKITKEDREVYGNSDVNLKKKLHKKFGFSPEYAKLISNKSLQDDYGSLSSRAINKILPFLKEGHEYSEACTLAGYNHSNSESKEDFSKRELKERLDILPKNSLRNPVVEKILNQMINLVNQVCETYGKPDEIRIELARELKKSAKEREEAVKYINAATKANDEIKKLIEKDFGFKPTKTDVVRYKLWEELANNGHKTVFTNKYIPREKIFSKDVDIEHIIPKALLFDDSFSNKTLAYRTVNLKKGSRTGLDFISQDYVSGLNDYKTRIESLFKANAISKAKYKKLLMSASNLPEDFIERDLRNSQYIAKKAKAILQDLVKKPIVSTSGSITDKLRKDWDLINVMKELNLPKYKALGLTQIENRWDSGQEKEKSFEVISDWTKRNDHRHHAMDALTVAFTTHNHIQYINYLSARKNESHDKHKIIKNIEHLITNPNKNGGNKVFVPPIENFRLEAKKHLESILISFKNKNKVTTTNRNTIKKGKNGKHVQSVKTPRGQLHKETVYGKSKQLMSKPTRISKKLSIQQIQLISNPSHKKQVLEHLKKFDNNVLIAFDTKTLKNTPLLYKNEPLKEVLCFEEIYTIRKEIASDLKLSKVVDEKVKNILKVRLAEYNNNPKEAFSDLEKNPIWLNKEKGISIKRVTITGVNNTEALHYKKDHLGKEILDQQGNKQAVDFVSTGNNHHIAIYKDVKGNLQEKVVSFYEVVARVNEGLSIIDKTYKEKEGWQFLFTMKQNEMFVFPNNDFNIDEIDLLDGKNACLISKHLFRVQKIAAKDYFFRHHLETTVTNNLDFTYKRKQTPNSLQGVIKVRINHIGQIVQVGEY
ncbi:type II CRISPR RNA-guided endonuclease Cas9 [Tenacibaculum sp. 1_MG-2023]|uniref:type II CRISPR RNA-guided endonuclease Cas9 n=1 Tax=Tenacibaculum sp. 1_MG-2023 TaxID=3062653 RepID=UPI0026E3405F|nr:type II CRISPR RNA-guided endonuclease Cas9 [Tenacibaculum sp. 1_MG-2023]MDO6674674.1 type II CRISPR RNA-guided endonuclease Cas9 [Tenacibaculum sp. 1_MG-2023]